MSLMQIKLEKEPVLRRKSKPVDKVDSRIKRLMDDMLETMYEAPGVGLAAPQVGINKRIVVVDVGEDGPGPLRMVNPKVTILSDEEELGPEGCLSCPGLVGDVWRAVKIGVKYLDEDGDKVEMEAEGFLARCIQHEVDHLDGVLYIDKAENIRSAEEDVVVEAAVGKDSEKGGA